MQHSGFASIPFWARTTSCGGTQLNNVPSEKSAHVSHGGTLSSSKNPFDAYLAAPSARFSTGTYKSNFPTSASGSYSFGLTSADRFETTERTTAFRSLSVRAPERVPVGQMAGERSWSFSGA